MTYRIYNCKTCGRPTYFEYGQQVTDCIGPMFKMDRRLARPYRRYGRLEWGHLVPEQAVEVEVENMNPSNELREPLDVRLVNKARSWLAKRSVSRG